MGWTLEQIKKELKAMAIEERQQHLEQEYREELREIYDKLIEELLSIQNKMSIYHNGYEEIKGGKDPSEVKDFLIELNYSEAEEMPNPNIKKVLKWFQEQFKKHFQKIFDLVNDILIYVTRALGSQVELENVSVTASIPPGITFNFSLK